MNEMSHEGFRKQTGMPTLHGENRNMTEEKQNSEAICLKCGNKTDKLFQNNTCKSCLVESFSKVKKMIDVYRKGYGESISGNSGHNGSTR